MLEKTGRVGAFWVIPGPRVIGEALDLNAATEVNETLDGVQGHNELWEHIERPVDLIDRTYTSIPRGRVIFITAKNCFVVYAAEEIVSSEGDRRAVESFYGIESNPSGVQWRLDSHYRTQSELLDQSLEFSDYYS